MLKRRQIKRWYNKEKMSNRKIALLLGKAPQTINNEIKRGYIQMKRTSKYSSEIAQAKYKEQKSHCGRYKLLTASINHNISKLRKRKIFPGSNHSKVAVNCCFENTV